MHVKQISIFLENRPGRLEEITSVLKGGDVNIRAMSLADMSDFGILRLIVNNPEKSIGLLKNKGFTVKENDVIAVEVDDKPGGLHTILHILGKAGISIEYMYASLRKNTDKAIIIIRVESNTESIKALQDAGIILLSSDTVYQTP